MKTKSIILSGLFLTSLAFANDPQVKELKEKAKEEKVEVKNSCSAEAQQAGCSDKEVGTGLMKCLHNYKREHKKDFKIGDSCRNSMKQMHATAKELKGMREEMKEKHEEMKK